MNLTLNELLKGKATQIKGNNYFETEAYVTPFLEKMSKFTNDFRVQAKLPDQITRTPEGETKSDDITYNRVWIQAVMPDEYCFENHQEVIGLVYGLDTRTPVAKIYRGALNMACLNLCIFNPTFLRVQELKPEKPINFQCVKTLMEETLDLKCWLEKLSSVDIPYDNTFINESLGSWVRNMLSCSYNSGCGKVKLATSTAIDAYKLLYEKKESPYFIKEGETTTMFNVYNAFTDIISNTDTKDIMNKAEKTLLLKEILHLD